MKNVLTSAAFGRGLLLTGQAPNAAATTAPAVASQKAAIPELR